MCTAFRDGFQSVFGSRILSKDYLSVVPEAVKAGLTHIESGGGAAFQSAFFYTNENAFQVMDDFRRAAGPQANLQTLARGVNVVGLDSQSSEIIKLHAELFKKHGVSTIRNFDALNDPDNLLYSAQCIKNAGLKHQLCIAMMSLPPGHANAHTPEFYEQTLKKFIKAKIPFDSLCVKDASGTSVPAVVFETIRRARRCVGERISIEFHSHETAGVGLACYLAAIQAGADIVDLSLAPVSGGTCQPDVATLWHALRGMPYELDCDIEAVLRVEEALKAAVDAYFMPPEAFRVDPLIPWSPMPGGALTANTQMLRDNGLMDKYPLIIKAMEEVVRKGGFGTSVTPVSQFYFQQAFNNVMSGPWAQIAEGYGKMVLGYFGKTPVAPDKKVAQIAAEQLGLRPTTETPLALNDRDEKKSRRFYESQLRENGILVTDENVFIVATCGEKGIAFLQGKGKVSVRYRENPPPAASAAAPVCQVRVAGRPFTVKLSEGQAEVNGKVYSVSWEQDKNAPTKESAPVAAPAAPAASAAPVPPPATAAATAAEIVETDTPGVITQILVRPGDRVEEAQEMMVIEVMKMETYVRALKRGVVRQIFVQKGDQVVAGQKLAEVAYE